MASPNVASPIMVCQCSMGSWLVTRVARRPARSSMRSRRSRRSRSPSGGGPRRRG
jgi:hypothetical protein